MKKLPIIGAIIAAVFAFMRLRSKKGAEHDTSPSEGHTSA